MTEEQQIEGLRTSCPPAAAYLYVLRLDGSELAWEYLRRNERYRSQWVDAQRRGQFADAAAWHLTFLEDPTLDARSATPCWREDLSPAVQLASHPRLNATATFAFWKIRGSKAITHDGSQLLLTARAGKTARAALNPDVTVDEPYAVVVPVNDPHRCRHLCQEAALYAGRAVHEVPLARPSRSALVHMRSLQALDAAEKGAAHREIAAAVFGTVAVEREWSPDGELRAQVRYYLRRGRALSNGGYRALLQS